MKKLHLLVGVFIFIGCLQVHAEKSRVAMEKWQTGNVVGSTTICRSPMRNNVMFSGANKYTDDYKSTDINPEQISIILENFRNNKVNR